MSGSADYTPTAHRGDQPIPPTGPDDRTPPGVAIPLRGVSCGEHLVVSDDGFFKFANVETAAYERSQARVRRYGGLPWAGIENIQMMACMARFSAGFIAVVMLFMGVPMLVITGILKGMLGAVLWDIATFLGIFAVSYAAYRLLDWLIRTDRIPDGKMVIFHRPSGMVRVPGKGGMVEEIPFRDFLPCMAQAYLLGGGGTTRLALSHRRQELVLSYGGTMSTDRWYPLAYWEFLQQYMDVTRPIPDVPEAEYTRWDDPVTRAWDERHGRPRYWWRGMSAERFEALYRESRAAAEGYPWARVLEGEGAAEAMAASGWTPSTYGRLPWVAAAHASHAAHATAPPPRTPPEPASAPGARPDEA